MTFPIVTDRQAAVPPSHEIIVVNTPEERQQCYDVRIKVFHLEQKFPLETEIDELVLVHCVVKEDCSTHFLLRLASSSSPIGTIRAYILPEGHVYKLSRLAVLQEYRRYHLGQELVLALHAWVKAHALKAGRIGSVEMICHSQIPVQGFYAKFGYKPEGVQFDEDGDPHQKMVFHMPL